MKKESSIIGGWEMGGGRWWSGAPGQESELRALSSRAVYRWAFDSPTAVLLIVH